MIEQKTSGAAAGPEEFQGILKCENIKIADSCSQDM